MKKRFFILFIFIIVAGIFVIAQRYSVTPVYIEYNGDYKVLYKTGNESLYNVTFENIIITEEREDIRNDTLICINAQWEEAERTEISFDEKTEEEIEKTFNYSVPTTLSLYKEKSVISSNLERELTHYNPVSLSSTYEINDTYSFCYQANPEEDFYLKFGDNSIIVIQEQDVFTNSLLNNVTAEGNFSHLNISTNAPYDSLLGYFPFDGDVSDTFPYVAYDWKGNVDGSGLDGTNITNTNCKTNFGNCLFVDGVDDNSNGVDLGTSEVYNFSKTNAFTISAWAKSDEATGVIFSRGITGSGKDLETVYMANFLGDMRCVVANGTERLAAVSVGDATTDDGIWHHYVCTFNGTLLTTYYEGLPVATDSDPDFGTINDLAGRRETGIGGDMDRQGTYWNGSIDDVMIFDIGLTQDQITDIYNNQSARFVKEGTQKVQAVQITNTTTWDNNGFDRVNLTTTFERNFDSNLSARIGQINLSVDSDGLNLYMPFEWGSAVDISNEGNDGTITDAIFNQTGGLNDTGGFEFDGDGDWVFVSNIGNPLDNQFITISAWINPSTDVISDAVNRVDQFSLGLRGSGLDTRAVFYNATDNIHVVTSLCSGVIVLNSWQFISVQNNGSHIVGYHNGVECGKSGFAGGISSSTADIYIGNSVFNNRDFNGTIDEVMVFNRSLSSSEISNLYTNQSQKFNVVYYTEHQNLSTSGSPTEFTISTEADFILPDYTFLAGNQTSLFYSPIIKGDITLETFFGGEAEPTDNPPVSTLSKPPNNNVSAQSTVNFECNATDDINLANVTLYVWNQSDGALFFTNTTTWSGTTNSTIFDRDFDSDNNHTWNCLVVDNASQSDWAPANFSLNITSVAADTCTYTSGDWVVDCADNCEITSPVDVGGNNIFITGTGRFSTTANIINYGKLHISGTDSSNQCRVTCLGGCFR